VDYRNICYKLVRSSDNTINIPIVNAFVIAVPWMIYAKYNSNIIDSQKFYEMKNESYLLFAVNF